MAEKKGDSHRRFFFSRRRPDGRTDAQNEIAPSAREELQALRLQRTAA